eukprot:1120496-Rhodomonas_salina.4
MPGSPTPAPSSTIRIPGATMRYVRARNQDALVSEDRPAHQGVGCDVATGILGATDTMLIPVITYGMWQADT